jgi:hypothetical protein
MSDSKAKLEASVERLRRQVAEAEATLGNLRARLAKSEAKLDGLPAPETGLDLLWKAALPTARTRSSKHQCRVEWNRIPKHERPTVQIAVDALYKWNRCPEWKRDGNAFVPGLHRWIKARQWENLPESADPLSRYRSPQPAAPPPRTKEDEEALRQFLSGGFKTNQPIMP